MWGTCKQTKWRKTSNFRQILLHPNMALAKEILMHMHFWHAFLVTGMGMTKYQIIQNNPQTLLGARETAIVKPILKTWTSFHIQTDWSYERSTAAELPKEKSKNPCPAEWMQRLIWVSAGCFAIARTWISLLMCAVWSRTRDKGSISVKYPNVLIKYSIIFKNLGIDTQLIWQSTQLLPNSWVKIKNFKARKAHDYNFILWLLHKIGVFILPMTKTVTKLKRYKAIPCFRYLNQVFCLLFLSVLKF